MMYKKEHNDYRRELSFLAFTQIGIFPKQEAKTSFFLFFWHCLHAVPNTINQKTNFTETLQIHLVTHDSFLHLLQFSKYLVGD